MQTKKVSLILKYTPNVRQKFNVWRCIFYIILDFEFKSIAISLCRVYNNYHNLPKIKDCFFKIFRLEILK